MKCIKNRLHVFCEINLLQNKYEEIIKTAELYKVKLFLSSTLLYRKEIEIIKDYVLKQKSKVNYKYHVGQYLPDWHPWEDYKNYFVKDKRTNACREIFAIELPWIIQTFGKVENFTVLKDNISGLEIDFPDNYFVLLEHEGGNKGILIVDIVSRKAERNLLVYSENLHLMWNGTPDSLSKYNIEKRETEKIETYSNVDKDERYAEGIIENEYLDELKVFVDKITEKQNDERYTFEDDKYTLQIIDRIEGIKA